MPLFHTLAVGYLSALSLSSLYTAFQAWRLHAWSEALAERIDPLRIK